MKAALLAAASLLALGASALAGALPPQPLPVFAFLYAAAFLGDLADLSAVLARAGESLVRFVSLAELVAEVGALSLISTAVGGQLPYAQPLIALAAASSAVPALLGRGEGESGRLAWVADPLLKYTATAAAAFAGFGLVALVCWVCSSLVVA